MRRPAWLSVRWWSSRSILTVSFCAFAAVLCILLGSNRYMADCVQQEAQAKENGGQGTVGYASVEDFKIF